MDESTRPIFVNLVLKISRWVQNLYNWLFKFSFSKIIIPQYYSTVYQAIELYQHIKSQNDKRKRQYFCKMQFHFILNGGEGPPPPSEFMVIVTVSLEVRYYVTACISTFIRYGMASNCMAFSFRYRTTHGARSLHNRTLRGCFVYYVCVGVGRLWGVKDILRSLLKASNNVFHYFIPGQHKCCISISLVQIQEKLWCCIVTQKMSKYTPPPSCTSGHFESKPYI